MGAGQYNQSDYPSFSSKSDYFSADAPFSYRITLKLSDGPGSIFRIRDGISSGQTTYGQTAFLMPADGRDSGIYIANRIPVRQSTSLDEIRTE
jgi:hypothetical protein